MDNWYTRNNKWLHPLLTFLGGLLLGFYLCILRYESQIETMKAEIKLEIYKVADAVSDLKNAIQNRVMTTVVTP